MDEHALLDKLATMLQSRTVPVTITDAEGRVVFVNEAVSALSGRTLDEVRGTRASSYFAPDDQERVRQAGELSATRREAVEVESVRVQRPDGSTRPIAMIVANLPNAKGEHFAKLAIGVDLTEQERLTNRLRVARDHLRFYGDLAAHDLRNYAQTVSGYLESLLRGQLGPLSPEQTRALQVCLRQTRRTDRLLEQVDLLMESEERKAEGRPAPLAPHPLAELLETTVSAVAADFPDRPPRVVSSVDPDATVLACDNLPHALDALLRDYMDRNPHPNPVLHIDVSPDTLREGPAWAITIQDNGPGLPEEVRDLLLIDCQYPVRPGSGAALRLAVAILHRCGGVLELDGHRLEPSDENAIRVDALAHATAPSARPQSPTRPQPSARSPEAAVPPAGDAPHESPLQSGTRTRLLLRAVQTCTPPDGTTAEQVSP